MDMSQASGAMYRILSTNYSRRISADCTSLQCSIQGYNGVTSIDKQTHAALNLYGTFKNIFFKKVGDANTVAMRVAVIGSILTDGVIDIEDNVFDTCGAIQMASGDMEAAAIFKLNNNAFLNSPILYPGYSPVNFAVSNITTAATSGVRPVFKITQVLLLQGMCLPEARKFTTLIRPLYLVTTFGGKMLGPAVVMGLAYRETLIMCTS